MSKALRQGLRVLLCSPRQEDEREFTSLVRSSRRFHAGWFAPDIQPGNTASSRLVGSLGFRREGFSPRYLKIGGRWRDHERWAILREEWSALRRQGHG